MDETPGQDEATRSRLLAEPSMPRALVVDDDPGFLEALAELVRREGFTVETAGTVARAREEIRNAPPDILLTDLHLPDGLGLDLLKDLDHASAPEVVLITGRATVETAVDALRRGVTDYLTKPVDIARVKVALANVSRALTMRREISTLRGDLRKLGRFGALVGASPAMQNVYDLIGRVAGTRASILISGETGTGKELVAETIHRLSRRRREPFVPVDCGGLSANLIESELFGHERGSFTGASHAHKGYFERADRGTLFLDEITEAVEIQVKLLRALESSTIVRVGGTERLKVDVRVIAATSRRVEEAVAAGRLREDLFYRLNVFPIRLPPLRERDDDVELLAQKFLDDLNAAEGTAKILSPSFLESLHGRAWPGNVRELRNLVHRAFILAEDVVGADTVPFTEPAKSTGRDWSQDVGISVAAMERHLIMATLEKYSNDKRRAAEVLKVSLKTLYNRLKEYGVDARRIGDDCRGGPRSTDTGAPISAPTPEAAGSSRDDSCDTPRCRPHVGFPEPAPETQAVLTREGASP